MYNIILHPTDLRENHFDICKKSAQIAENFGAKIHLLHVIEPPSSYQLAQSLGFTEMAVPVQEDAKTVMKLIGEALNIPQQQQHVAVGSVKTHIFKLAQTLACDLIIVGSHTSNTVPAFLGSTAYAVIHQASCDVMTLRAND